MNKYLIKTIIIISLGYALLWCCNDNSYNEANKDSETRIFEANSMNFRGVSIDTVFRETLELLLRDICIDFGFSVNSVEYAFQPSSRLFETDEAMLFADIADHGNSESVIITLTGVGDPDHDNLLEISYMWRESALHGASGWSTNGVVEYSSEGIRYENETILKRVNETIEKVWRSRFPFSTRVIPYPLEIKNDTIQVTVNVKYPGDDCNACFLYTGIAKYTLTDSLQLVLLYEEIKRTRGGE